MEGRPSPNIRLQRITLLRERLRECSSMVPCSERDVYGIPEHKRVTYAANALRDDAATFYYYLVQTNHEQDPSWERFQQEFRLKYDDSQARRNRLRHQLATVPFHGMRHMDEYIGKSDRLKPKYTTWHLKIVFETLYNPSQCKYERKSMRQICRRRIWRLRIKWQWIGHRAMKRQDSLKHRVVDLTTLTSRRRVCCDSASNGKSTNTLRRKRASPSTIAVMS